MRTVHPAVFMMPLLLAPSASVHTNVVNMLDPEMVGTPMHAKRSAELKLQLQANDGRVELPGLCERWGCTCQGFSDHFGAVGSPPAGGSPPAWGGTEHTVCRAKEWFRAHKCSTAPSWLQPGGDQSSSPATIYFLHARKAAGTTVGMWLDAVTKHSIQFQGGTREKAISTEGPNLYRHKGRDEIWVTTVREPLDRIRSQYAYEERWRVTDPDMSLNLDFRRHTPKKQCANLGACCHVEGAVFVNESMVVETPFGASFAKLNHPNCRHQTWTEHSNAFTRWFSGCGEARMIQNDRSFGTGTRPSADYLATAVRNLKLFDVVIDTHQLGDPAYVAKLQRCLNTAVPMMRTLPGFNGKEAAYLNTVHPLPDWTHEMRVALKRANRKGLDVAVQAEPASLTPSR